MEQYYTKEQVSEKLEIAQSSVYVLAKKKLIEVEVLPQGVSRTKRYTKSSVDAYANRRVIDKKGLTVAEFAKKENLSPQRVYQAIKKLKLPLERVRLGKRDRLLITAEHQQLLIKELQHKKHKGTKTDFYRSSEDIALFQLFQDSTQMPYRVMRNEVGEWGFLLPDMQTFMPYEQAMSELQLQAMYTIHQPVLTANVYADFSFQLEDARTFEVIDFFYQIAGAENMHLQQVEKTIEVCIKAVAFDVDDRNMALDYLNENCLNAVIEHAEGELRIRSVNKSVTVLLEADVYEALKQQRAVQNKSMTEIINAVLRQKYL